MYSFLPSLLPKKEPAKVITWWRVLGRGEGLLTFTQTCEGSQVRLSRLPISTVFRSDSGKPFFQTQSLKRFSRHKTTELVHWTNLSGDLVRLTVSCVCMGQGRDTPAQFHR